MSAKKKPVSTPLHLLQQLTASLLDHFENACTHALTDAEKVLAKLEKQRTKVQEKLHKQRTRVEEAAAAGKAKAQLKARANVEVLESALDDLQRRQRETRHYIGELKNDVQAGLALAQGVGNVREAVTRALDKRSAKSATVPPSVTPARKAVPHQATAATPAIPATDSVPAPAIKPPGRRPAVRKAALATAVHSGEDVATAPAAAALTKRAPRKPRTAASASKSVAGKVSASKASTGGNGGPANG